MSKKNFTGGLSSLLGDAPEPNQEATHQETPKSSRGPKPNPAKQDDIRATYILNRDLVEKVKAIAYWDRKDIKEVANEVFTDYISKYEKKNGEIKPIPTKK